VALAPIAADQSLVSRAAAPFQKLSVLDQPISPRKWSKQLLHKRSTGTFALTDPGHGVALLRIAR
jgi:hypothetical protein